MLLARLAGLETEDVGINLLPITEAIGAAVELAIVAVALLLFRKSEDERNCSCKTETFMAASISWLSLKLPGSCYVTP